MKDIRFVVVHLPGPGWKRGAPLFEQVGVHAHIEHYRAFFADGKLTMGGPFLDDESGGMMIPDAGLSEEEIRKHAGEDPAVKSGLLTFAIRPWLVGMKK